MPFTPTAGPVALLKAAAAGGSPATVPGINWKIAIDGHVVDISNFSQGRLNTGTLEGAEFSCTLVWDSAAQPNDPANAGFDASLLCDIRCYTSASKYYTGRFVISTVEPGVEAMENVVMYPVTGKLNGTLTRPA